MCDDPVTTSQSETQSCEGMFELDQTNKVIGFAISGIGKITGAVAAIQLANGALTNVNLDLPDGKVFDQKRFSQEKNKMKIRRKRFFTLLEIMIVIFLIGLIGSVIGFNMKGSLDKGKAFRTEQAMHQIEDILTLMLAQGETTSIEIKERLVEVLKRSEYIKEPEKIVKDGWGNDFMVTVDDKNNVKVESARLVAYKQKQ